MTLLIKIRKNQKDFHPDAHRKTLNLGRKFFGIKRTSVDKKQSIICVTNITSVKQAIYLSKDMLKGKNLFKEKILVNGKNAQLLPFQTIWIKTIY